jgi:hypothetical protein
LYWLQENNTIKQISQSPAPYPASTSHTVATKDVQLQLFQDVHEKGVDLRQQTKQKDDWKS